MKFTRTDYPIRRLASGAQLNIPVYHFQGQSGKHVYIQANIHGPEIAGIGAAHHLIKILQQMETINGSITLVPSVNPVGLDTKFGGYQVGYVDPNESAVGNFNRIYQMLVDDKSHSKRISLPDFVQQHLNADEQTIVQNFKKSLAQTVRTMRDSYEGYGMRHGLKLAYFIQEMAVQADYLIDLHTAGEALYHHFTFAECLESAKYFGISYIIQLDDSFSGVLDESFLQPWLRLQQAFADAGRSIQFDKEAFTPELGSADTLFAENIASDAERILNYLRYKGVIPGEAVVPDMPFYVCPADDYKRYYAPTGGLVLWHKKLGDTIEKGEVIASVLQVTEPSSTESAVEVPIIAHSSGVINNRNESQVVHEGLVLCSVLTTLQEI
jgi:predicted deacylase